MSILNQLSSQTGDRSEYHNRKAAIQCLEDPALLEEIAAGLRQKNAALLGDCAEVMTMVAVDRPEWVAPYAGALAALVGHKTTRVRWEAVHALALVAERCPEVIGGLLPELAVRLRGDASVIVRDYATDILAGYAASGPSAAESAYPLLKEMLTAWDGKQAAHALKGLASVAGQVPALRGEVRAIAAEFARAERPVVRKAAKELENLLKAL